MKERRLKNGIPCEEEVYDTQGSCDAAELSEYAAEGFLSEP